LNGLGIVNILKMNYISHESSAAQPNYIIYNHLYICVIELNKIPLYFKRTKKNMLCIKKQTSPYIQSASVHTQEATFLQSLKLCKLENSDDKLVHNTKGRQ
jgi:hypothetical protein